VIPKIKLTKRPLANFWILSLSFFLTVGCSTFHERSVVSHGDEVAPGRETEAEKAGVVSLPPTEVDSSSFQLQQNELTQLPPSSPVVPPTLTVPIIPPTIPSPAKGAVGADIFAQPADDLTLPWTLEDVFFDYDQMLIRRDAIPLLEQNAKVLLKRYANREVLIQGHCDERGTEAYNLILGERRATAVKNYLVNLGVAASQLQVLSLGKSQPFCQKRTISCFRQNRRAHFVID
jgi:peptidoglycan-associated lipoprotein